MTPKKTVDNFKKAMAKTIKKVKAGKSLTVIEKWLLFEMDRITALATGKMDPGPLVAPDHFINVVKIGKVSLGQWRKRGFPESEPVIKKLNIFKALAWVRDCWIKDRDKQNRKDGPGVLEDARARKAIADAMKIEMEIAENEERLVERELIWRSLGEHVSTASKMIQDLPRRMARHVPPAKRKQFVEEAEMETNDVLKYLSETGKKGK